MLVSIFRTLRIKLKTQVSTSRIFVRILALPPVDWSKTFPQTKQFTSVAEHPKIIWVFPQFKHLTLKKRDFGSGIKSFFFLILTMYGH